MAHQWHIVAPTCHELSPYLAETGRILRKNDSLLEKRSNRLSPTVYPTGALPSEGRELSRRPDSNRSPFITSATMMRESGMPEPGPAPDLLSDEL
jgi:hypothetical protein